VPRERFWRNASGCLTLDQAGIDSTHYPALCRALADAVGLEQCGDFVIGPDQIFCDFARDDQIVGIEWDVWMDFMVVAKTRPAESLVREIGSWLDTNGLSQSKARDKRVPDG
jgi:hypothetical protein